MHQVKGMATGSWWQDLFEELKRRRVFRVATLYIVAFWPLIQIVDIMTPTLELPDSVMRYLVFAFLIGFPIVLIFAWIFDVNKDGVAVTSSTTEEGSSPLIGGRTEVMIVGALLVVVIGLFAVQLQLDGPVGQPAETGSYSVGVLPFISFSDNVAHQQFADGLTEELLNVLSRIKALRVAARTSSFAYRGVNKNVTEIGKELNVDIILEGSVRRNDVNDKIRVTAQLIDTKTGSHIWSQTYDKEFTDIFQIQDDIAASVVDELQITLLGNEREKIQSRSSASPEAIVAYGMGQAELARRSALSIRDAIRFFNKAIEQDPNYVDAYVGLATAYTLIVSYEHGTADKFLPQAQAAVNKAFDLDAESGAAWATLGLIHMQRKKKDEAKAALEKAMEYNPSYAMAFMWYAGMQEFPEERLNWYERAYQLDPKSPVIGYNVANIMLNQGRDVEAMEVFARIVESDPHYHGAYHLSARINEARGRLDEAINQYKKAYELSPDTNYAVNIASLYIDLGDFDAAQRWLGNVGELPAQYAYQLEWLEISALASADRIDEAYPLLQAKVDRAASGSSRRILSDAAYAAYYLGNFDMLISVYERLPDDIDPHAMDPGLHLNTAIAAAYAYDLAGETVKRDQAINTAETFLETTTLPQDFGFDIWYERALLTIVKGDRQRALIHLQRAIDEGWRQHWRTRVEPIIDDLRDDESFQSMMAGLETRMDIMREQLTLADAFDSSWSG